MVEAVEDCALTLEQLRSRVPADLMGEAGSPQNSVNNNRMDHLQLGGHDGENASRVNSLPRVFISPDMFCLVSRLMQP